MPQWFSIRLVGLSLLIAALTWLVFGSLTSSNFVNFDDDVYVYENPTVRSGISAENIGWAFTHVHASNWHPLTTLSHMLDCQWYGLAPGAHHRTNILLHIATAIALFLVVRQMTHTVWPGFFVALVFALHPLRVESVAWISERKDVMSGLCFMLTLAAYVFYARREWSWSRYLPVVCLFSLGLMAKPTMVTLPLVLLLLDYWPLQRFPLANCPGFPLPRRVILEKLPLLALSIALSLTVYQIQDQARSSGDAIPFSMRVGNALVSVITYLGQLFCPVNLAAYYPYPPVGQSAFAVTCAVLIIVGLTIWFVRQRQNCPWLLVGWGWYLIMLVPVIGLIQVGAQAHADRYTYLPEIGLCLGLVWALNEGSRTWPKREVALGGLAAMLLLTLIIQARVQVTYWRDSETLWRHALVCTDNNALAESNLAAALFQQGRLDETVEHARKAVGLNADYVEAQNTLGHALYQQGNMDEAAEHLQRAFALKPDFAAAHNNYGLVLLREQQWEAAREQFQTAVDLQPGMPDAYDNLGVVLFQLGRSEEALLHYEQAIRIQPQFPAALNNCAWLLSTVTNAALRNGSKAVQLAQAASLLSGSTNVVVLRTLAAAYAEDHQFPMAVAILKKALALASQPGASPWSPVLQSELVLYQSGQPLRAHGQTP